MDAETPEQLAHKREYEHAGHRHEGRQRDGQDTGDGAREHDADGHLGKRVETMPEQDADDERHEGRESVRKELRNRVGHLEAHVMLLAEIDDLDRNQRDDERGEETGAAKVGGGEHSHGRAILQGDTLNGSTHEQEENHGDDAVRQRALHLQVLGVDVAHGEGHDDAQDAHGHVIGRGEPHIGGVGRLEHAYDIQQRGDDGEDGAGEDDRHGRHHATADGGQGLVGLELAAPFLQLHHHWGLIQVVKFGHWCSVSLRSRRVSSPGRETR